MSNVSNDPKDYVFSITKDPDFCNGETFVVIEEKKFWDRHHHLSDAPKIEETDILKRLVKQGLIDWEGADPESYWESFILDLGELKEKLIEFGLVYVEMDAPEDEEWEGCSC